VISYTTIHTPPLRRSGPTAAVVAARALRFATRVLGYDIKTRTCGASPPAPCSTGPSGRSARYRLAHRPDTADGRPHLLAVVGSGCLGMNMAVIASGYLGMNMAVVTVVAGPDGTLALRGVAFEDIVKQRAGRKAVELCRTRLLTNHDGAGSRGGAWPAGGRQRRPSSAVLSRGRGSSLEERHAVQPAQRRARSYQNCRSTPHP
jgi:hypothetical protein